MIEPQLTLWDIRVRREQHELFLNPETPDGQQSLGLIRRLTEKGYKVKVVERKNDEGIELWTPAGPIRGLKGIKYFVERELRLLKEVPDPAPGSTQAR